MFFPRPSSWHFLLFLFDFGSQCSEEVQCAMVKVFVADMVLPEAANVSLLANNWKNMRAFKPVLLKTVQTWSLWFLEILVSPFPVPRVGVARTQPVPTLIPVFWVRAVRTLHQSLFPEWGQLAPSLSLHPSLFQGWWAGRSTCTALVAWGDSRGVRSSLSVSCTVMEGDSWAPS